MPYNGPTSSGGGRGSKYRPTGRESDSPFMKVLHGLQTPLYMTAGLIEEYQKREDGKMPTPYSTILKESGNNLLPFWGEKRRRTTYGDIVDNKVLAFGLDIFGDPITYIPAAWMGKALKGASFLTTKPAIGISKGILKGTDAITGFKTYEGVARVKDMIGEMFQANYRIKEIGALKLIRKQTEYRNKVSHEVSKVRENLEKELKGLLPRQSDRADIFDLAHRRPAKLPGHEFTPDQLKTLEANADYVSWRSEVAGLSPEKLGAYEHVVRIQDELESLKIGSGLLSMEQAAGFLKKQGFGYLPHYRATTKTGLSETIDEFMKAYEAGEEWALRRVNGMYELTDGGKLLVKQSSALKKLSKMQKQIDDIDSVMLPEELDAIRKGLSFTKERKNSLKEINMDIAEVMGIQAGQVHKGLLAVKYVKGMGKWAADHGYMWDDMPGPEDLHKYFGKVTSRKIARGGFEKLGDDVGKEFAGKYVPKALAGEIRTAMKAYKNPEQIKAALEIYKKYQNMWKAWTLAIFPTYHFRNGISNVWNNFLAGMGVESSHHYFQAIGILTKKSLGSLSKSDAALLDEASRVGVLKGGMWRGEMGEIINDSRPIGRAVARVLHPRDNIAIKLGFRAGNQIEDSARLAHYIWARSKGMKKLDAARSVNKYLFDYKYGLTPFERKVFRDFSMPFYAWTRFNLPLQLETLAMKPGRFAVMPKGMRALEDVGAHLTDENGSPTPNEMFMADWMKRATKIRFRFNKKTGAHEYFMLDNWIPSAELNKLFNIKEFRNSIKGLLSPGIKLPIEIIENYNLWRKQKIKVYPGQRGELLGMKIEPHLEHLSRSIRLINEADKMYQLFQYKGKEVSKTEVISSIGIGKLYPYRPEKQKKWWVWEMNKRVGELGGMRRFAEKRGWKDQVGVLDGLIEEIKAERDYYKKLKVGR